MPMRIVDINTDISSAYADALGKMEIVELTRGDTDHARRAPSIPARSQRPGDRSPLWA